MGSSIGIVVRLNDNILDHATIVAIVIHEITHCSYSDHGQKFVELEQALREKYLRIAPSLGSIKVWDKFEFPISTGKSLIIGNDMAIIKIIKWIVSQLKLLLFLIVLIIVVKSNYIFIIEIIK